jgi:rubrerythrin
MIEDLRQREANAVSIYQNLIYIADAVGEVGLRVSLEDILEVETNHLHELDRLSNFSR